MYPHWSEDAVFYHIYTLSLVRAERENDYSTQHHELFEFVKWLSHIKTLGCNALLFSPVLQARSHGYNVTDYYKLDNRIGTNEEFKSLVRMFHENGVRVILDSVFNHCGRDFFAFKELCEGNKGYADWFSGVDFSQSSPLGDPFTYDTWSGHFSLPKFNLRNEGVRKYLLNAARFWIDTFDIDGMRLDAANELDFKFMQDLRYATTAKKSDFWLMGEVVHGDYSKWVGADALHSVTNYALFASLVSSHNSNNLYELGHCLANTKPSHGLPLYNFLDNHDQPRIATSVNNHKLLNPLYTLLFTLPGIPSIYYGSEWGIPGDRQKSSDQQLRPFIDIANPPFDVPWLKSRICKLSSIRHEQEALKYGDYRPVYLEYRKPFIFERFFGSHRVFVAVNIEDCRESINLAGYHSRGFIDLLTGQRIHPQAAGAIPIAPFSSHILLAD